jgi:hypothetical protein
MLLSSGAECNLRASLCVQLRRFNQSGHCKNLSAPQGSTLASLPKARSRDDDDQAIQIIHIAEKALEVRRTPQVQRQSIWFTLVNLAEQSLCYKFRHSGKGQGFLQSGVSAPASG